MGIVWHGNHVKFLEDGRESFGKKFGMGYMDVYGHGFMIPLVNLDIDYKRPIAYADEVELITQLHETLAAKVLFKYQLRNSRTGEICAVAETTQAFIDLKGELQLTYPEFYLKWRNSLPWTDTSD
jgi:acyl-CoA thioester hydrolase